MAIPYVSTTGGDKTIAQSTVSNSTSVSVGPAVAVDSAGGNRVATYAWSLLYKPPGSDAVIRGGTETTNTAIVDHVDTWGNYLLFLNVTDAYGQVSETRPELSPSTAFAVIRVTATTTSLQKIAGGERNWVELYNALVAQVDLNARADTTFTVAEISDTVATGPQLNSLVGNGTVLSNMHKHDGNDVLPATQTGRGTVQLAEAPVDSANPKVVNKARGVYSAGFLKPLGEDLIVGSPGNLYRTVWRTEEAISVSSVSASSEMVHADKPTVHQIRWMTESEFKASDFSDASKILGTITLQHSLVSDDTKPLGGHVSIDPYKSVPAGSYIVSRLTTAGGATEATTAATGIVEIINWDTIDGDVLRITTKAGANSDITFGVLASGTVTVGDYTSNSGKSLTITYPDASTTVVTEGTHWDSVTNNNTAAAALKDAINAATTKVTATVSTNVVTIKAKLNKGTTGNSVAMALTAGSGMALSGANLASGANNNIVPATSNDATAALLATYVDSNLAAKWADSRTDAKVTFTCVEDHGADGNDDTFTITSANSSIAQHQAFAGGVDENAGYEVDHWINVHWRKEF